MLLQPVKNVSVCQRKWQNCQLSQGGSHILTWWISRILGKGSHSVSGRGSHLPLKMDMVLPGWMAFHSPFKPYDAMALWTASYSSKVNDHKKFIQREIRCHSTIKTKKKNWISFGADPTCMSAESSLISIWQKMLHITQEWDHKLSWNHLTHRKANKLLKFNCSKCKREWKYSSSIDQHVSRYQKQPQKTVWNIFTGFLTDYHF